ENFYLPLMSELRKETPKTIKDKLSRFLKEVKIFFINNFGKFIGITVIVAGLIDGINPCAISLLIFFIFSLSKLRGPKKLMLFAGSSFISGIFISYFLIGIGVLELVINPLYLSIYNWLYITIGILALIISGISLWDFYCAKNKKTRNIKLQLPIGLKRIGHSLIRDISIIKNPLLIFGLGVITSFIEFPCSGQVYLPTVTLIGSPLSSIKPFLLLLLYNFMFILPLIAILVVSILWFSSEKISRFVSKNLALTKLMTAGLFLLLGVYMLVFV
ncbi:MAG: cytochrome c biogenesis CcdA family protein, partial [bacterium]